MKPTPKHYFIERRISEKNGVKNKFSNQEKKDMNAVKRRMKGPGVPIDIFLKVFSGDEYVEYCEQPRKLKRYRKAINKLKERHNQFKEVTI